MKSEYTVPDGIVPRATPRLGESQADYRQRTELLRAEAVEHRQKELAEQCSPSNTPADRIRMWEHLHQLPLPRSCSHRLIAVIAADTGLSIAAVQSEQRARVAAKPTATTG